MKYDTERTTFKFQSGWNKFVQDNKLNAGDVCGFMLIDEIGLLFEVNIFRRTEVATSSPGIDEDDVDDKDDHDANDDYAADENGHRSFRNVLQKTAISHYLWLCSRFSEKHLSKKPSNAELHVPGGRTTWHVGLKYDVGRKGAKFQSGWTKFVRDNNLKKGDECVFVLTDENKFSFEVVIIAAKSTLPPGEGHVDIDDANDNIKDDEDGKNEDDTSDDEGDDYDDDSDHRDEDEDEDNEYSSAQQLHKRKRSSSSTKSSIRDVGASTSTGQFLKRRPGVPRSTHPIRTTKNDIALQRAKVFKYVEPHFVVPMTARNVHESFLKLPSVFVEKNLHKRPSHVSLWGSNDIYWPVELHFSKGASFQGGWIEFVRHHSLKEGDACGFELTEKRKFLFDVHIFRTT
ncbi:B3 domain-containing transcription factor VRN1-like [Rosa rugosa]|uniref:B3 domain-containing transcription factor VRN1-like n=1 Tax=Rosa rugosa TaxID=74645 RepID=UPI002B408871|nr:B3 domain-containing transcription factor VRN1-like [Rosa rugosa]